MSETNPPIEHNRVNPRPAALAGAAGTVVEWYDYELYGTATALIINPLLSPSASQYPGEEPGSEGVEA